MRNWPGDPNPPPGVRGAVFMCDGAGDFRVSSSMLRKVVLEDGHPLHLVHFPWSHGHFRVIADQTDYAHIRAQGKILADEVLSYHQQHPTIPIYLWGHSAGATVTVAALENLPPGVVDRTLLLSPAMSTCYDLRPSLMVVKKGIHVFYSRHDRVYLGLAMRLVGTTDGECAKAGGRVGFRVRACSPEDQALFSKLYQRRWTHPALATGNKGGHYGNYEPPFIRQQFIPLLLGCEPTCCPATEQTADDETP